MNSMATGTMPPAMMAATQDAAASVELKPSSIGRAPSGAFEQTHGRLGNDAELALRAGNERQEIVAGSIEIGAADVDDLAIHHDHADTEQVVHGDAIFEAMGAAGIGGDVATHRAGDLARRIGCVEEALAGCRLRDGDIGDAGLDAGHAVGGIDRKDLPHARQTDNDRILERQCAATQRRAGPARHDLDVVVMAKAQDRRDLLGAAWQHDGERQAAIRGQRIGFEGAAPLFVDNQHRLGNEPLQLLHDVVPAANDGAVRIGKSDCRHR